MAEVLKSVDVEQFLTDWLRDQLAANDIIAVVQNKKAQPTPQGPYVLVRRVGGTRSGVVSSARVLVECAGPTAASLAILVGALINSLKGQMVDDVIVYGVTEISGIANLAGTHSGTRYGQTFGIDTRLQVAT